MPNGGSVNQIESSDFTTTSFGELSGLPLNLSASTVMPPSYSARVVLAGDEAALAVARVAVGVVGGLAINAGAAGLFVPAHDAVVRDVAPQQAARVAEIDRAFVPARPGVKPLHAREPKPEIVERRIEYLNV